MVCKAFLCVASTRYHSFRMSFSSFSHPFINILIRFDLCQFHLWWVHNNATSNSRVCVLCQLVKCVCQTVRQMAWWPNAPALPSSTLPWQSAFDKKLLELNVRKCPNAQAVRLLSIDMPNTTTHNDLVHRSWVGRPCSHDAVQSLSGHF